MLGCDYLAYCCLWCLTCCDTFTCVWVGICLSCCRLWFGFCLVVCDFVFELFDFGVYRFVCVGLVVCFDLFAWFVGFDVIDLNLNLIVM